MAVKSTSDTGFDLRSVIERLGLSQRKLARLLGATQDWVGRIHNGHSAPSWATVLRIARALEVSVAVFVRGDAAREAFLGGAGGVPADQLAAERRAAGIGPRPTQASGGRRKKQPAA